MSLPIRPWRDQKSPQQRSAIGNDFAAKLRVGFLDGLDRNPPSTEGSLNRLHSLLPAGPFEFAISRPEWVNSSLDVLEIDAERPPRREIHTVVLEQPRPLLG